MDVFQFQKEWRNVTSSERSSAQSHFIALSRALDVPAPGDGGTSSDSYTFERPVIKTSGEKGFADVWFRDHFAWEYKRRGDNNFTKAYQQLLDYRESLENPPLLVVCNFDRFQIHTNFTGTVKRVYEISHDDLHLPSSQQTLRLLHRDPIKLKPDATVEEVTVGAAARFGELAMRLRARGADPHQVAHFLVQLLFCMFAEDIGLLRERLFSKLVTNTATDPRRFTRQITLLFETMREGGDFGIDEIPHFNGGLFTDISVPELQPADIKAIADASTLDWSSIEPAIFGTLFERSLDPGKRAQLGAHYTGRADIERVVEAVIEQPLRRRWDAVREEAMKHHDRWQNATQRSSARTRNYKALQECLLTFKEELRTITVLDPACGSGNFLYVALERLLDLEREVSRFSAEHDLPGMYPAVSPQQLRGLEINDYARELAQVVVWIGYLQWLSDNGSLGSRQGAVLDTLDTIQLQDALLDRTDPQHPREAQWPGADFIVGNPPFLGAKKLRRELGNEYTSALFDVYGDRVPGMSDLCCYFFEKARLQISSEATQRVGLLATNSIRGGASRTVLDRIKDSGDIFMAWPDEPWILDGAAVRISIVGFDDGKEQERSLGGESVLTINSALTPGVSVRAVSALRSNRGLSFVGDVKAGPFDVPGHVARQWLSLPVNPNGRPNSDVVRPYLIALDVTRHPRDVWVVDFGVDMPLNEAELYEAPFEHVLRYVKPKRDLVRRDRYRNYWWLHAEPVGGMRRATERLRRYIVTPAVSKHRVFAWVSGNALADHALTVFARDDDYFFGVLHSRAHEVWSLRMGTWMGKGNDPRYTPTTCFETFALPRPTDEQRDAIGNVAKRLDDLRRNWLNPPDANEAELKKRTLTNLYNSRPVWLARLHDALDQAVWGAYGWSDLPADTSDEMILERLLALNLERACEVQELEPTAQMSLSPADVEVTVSRR